VQPVLLHCLLAANCPHTLPVQLLEDCITYENAGHSFPPSDYVYMEQYQDWLKTQQEKSQTDIAGMLKINNTA
jgi:hypothetical protein